MKLATIRTRLGKATPTANRNFLNGKVPLSTMVQPEKINNLNGSQNGLFWSVLVNSGHFYKFLSIYDSFDQFWSILVNSGQFWSV